MREQFINSVELPDITLVENSNFLLSFAIPIELLEQRVRR